MKAKEKKKSHKSICVVISHGFGVLARLDVQDVTSSPAKPRGACSAAGALLLDALEGKARWFYKI